MLRGALWYWPWLLTVLTIIGPGYGLALLVRIDRRVSQLYRDRQRTEHRPGEEPR